MSADGELSECLTMNDYIETSSGRILNYCPRTERHQIEGSEVGPVSGAVRCPNVDDWNADVVDAEPGGSTTWTQSVQAR